MHIPAWPDTITTLWEELAQAPRGLGAPQEDRRSRALLREELARYSLPLREEPFAAPGWTLAGEPRLTVGGTELVAQALIATTGTPAAGVETTSAPPSPPAEHRALRRSRPALSSGRSRSWRDAAERANDRRRAQNVSIDGLNQAIVGQSTLLEMLSAERVERKDIVVLLACRGRARP